MVYKQISFRFLKYQDEFTLLLTPENLRLKTTVGIGAFLMEGRQVPSIVIIAGLVLLSQGCLLVLIDS